MLRAGLPGTRRALVCPAVTPTELVVAGSRCSNRRSPESFGRCIAPTAITMADSAADFGAPAVAQEGRPDRTELQHPARHPPRRNAAAERGPLSAGAPLLHSRRRCYGHHRGLRHFLPKTKKRRYITVRGRAFSHRVLWPRPSTQLGRYIISQVSFNHVAQLFLVIFLSSPPCISIKIDLKKKKWPKILLDLGMPCPILSLYYLLLSVLFIKLGLIK